MSVDVVGVTPVVARLIRYTVKDKKSQSEPRVLHMAGLNCRPETAEREFATTRRRHGTQGATRMSPAKFELPEPGEVATHVRRTRPNGRRVWDVAKDHETATHMRRDGHLVRQAEGRHLITSFGADEVNPDDPEQVALAFQYVVDRHRALYPGEQAHFVGQADGAGRAFHVHVTRNATLFADMEVDGKLYRAGSKLAGELTDVDSIRERSDAFVAEHGHEYGLGPQRLASVAERKRETRNSRDRRMAAKGEKSNHDIIRDAFEDSLADPRSVDLDGFVEVMQERGVAVIHRVTRAGKTGEKHALSYRLPEMPQNVRGTSLGDYYTFDSTVALLASNAASLPREPRPVRVQAGLPRAAAVPTESELTEAHVAVSRMAIAERNEQIADQMALDYFPAIAEDFDAATQAERTGDHETLAKLAGARREREASEKTEPTTEPTTTVTTSPEGKAVHEPVVAEVVTPVEQPRQPETLEDEPILATEATSDVEPEAAASAPAPAVEPVVVEPVVEPALRRMALFDEEELDAEIPSIKPKSYAPALTEPIEPPPTAGAAAPVENMDEAPYVSRLRGLRTKNPKTQAIVDAMVIFDEDARAALLRGERINEAHVPKGVGPSFLKALGDKLDPLVYEQLMLREEKKKLADAQYQKGARATKELVEMGQLAEQQGDFTGMWQFGKDAQDLASERDLANRRRDKLRAQIAAGVYEPVSDGTWAKLTATRATESENVPERDTRSL